MGSSELQFSRVMSSAGMRALIVVAVCVSSSLGEYTTEPGLEIVEPMSRAGDDDFFYETDFVRCPTGTTCRVLSECRLLQDLMKKSCLSTHRLRDIMCNYRKIEPMVCCPIGGDSSPFSSAGSYPGAGTTGTSYNPPKNATTEMNKLNQNCGRPHLNGWKNGYMGLGSQPWVAKVGYKADKREVVDYPCCGSIITNKVILTAAHCALAEPPGYSLHSVRIGDYDSRMDPDCTSSFCAYPAQDMDISHVIVHPAFEKGVYRHDVALIILKTPIVYSVAVQPVCLLQNPSIGLVGRRGKLVGWGKLAGQDVAPQKEQQIDLPVIPLEHCSKIYGRVIPITSNHLCAGGEAKKDACSGFGGAPLVMLDHFTKDRYYQVGMLSFGSDKCGAAGIPSVYTRISHYYDWISANIPY